MRMRTPRFLTKRLRRGLRKARKAIFRCGSSSDRMLEPLVADYFVNAILLPLLPHSVRCVANRHCTNSCKRKSRSSAPQSCSPRCVILIAKFSRHSQPRSRICSRLAICAGVSLTLPIVGMLREANIGAFRSTSSIPSVRSFSTASRCKLGWELRLPPPTRKRKNSRTSAASWSSGPARFVR